MQEHFDPAQVLRSQVDFLTVETMPDVLLTQKLGELQQQRAGTAGRPSLRSPMASSSLTNFSLRLTTVLPSLALLTSMSPKKLLRSFSDWSPTAEPSILRKTWARASLRSWSFRAHP